MSNTSLSHRISFGATSSPYSDDTEFQSIILVLLFALPQEVVADQRNKTEDRHCHHSCKDFRGLEVKTVPMNMFLRYWMLFILLPFVQHSQDIFHQFVYGFGFLILDAHLHINVLVKYVFCPLLVLIEQFLVLLFAAFYLLRWNRERNRTVLLFFQPL